MATWSPLGFGGLWRLALPLGCSVLKVCILYSVDRNKTQGTETSWMSRMETGKMSGWVLECAKHIEKRGHIETESLICIHPMLAQGECHIQKDYVDFHRHTNVPYYLQ